ncbi:MAG: 4'-phosphopantetheinyl transferase superfamily protein [Schwartzia sp.]|nr:4'-phosphopantetheinyl transferase superfamily protein [Schwartzia sp. (in: firmicutes)]
MTEISILFLDDWLTRDVAPYLRFASDARQASVAKVRAAADKSRSLWAELFARWRVAQAAGIQPSEVTLDHDEKGAPFCQGRERSISLSHSGPYIAVAVGDAPVGVDVERKRKAPSGVAKRWFRPEENAFLQSLSEEAYPSAFFRLWTIKEAALKYTGEGLSGGLENVDALRLAAAQDGPDDAPAALSFSLPQEAVASVVAKRRDLPEKARFFALETSAHGVYGNAFFTEIDTVFLQGNNE